MSVGTAGRDRILRLAPLSVLAACVVVVTVLDDCLAVSARERRIRAGIDRSVDIRIGRLRSDTDRLTRAARIRGWPLRRPYTAADLRRNRRAATTGLLRVTPGGRISLPARDRIQLRARAEAGRMRPR